MLTRRQTQKLRLFDKNDPAFLIKLPVQHERKPDAWFRSEPYLALVRKLPCRACGRTSHVAAAHLSKGTDAAKSERASDVFANPLCDGYLAGGAFYGCHNRQHDIGEVTFWTPFGGVDLIRMEALQRAAASQIRPASAAAINILAGRDWREDA